MGRHRLDAFKAKHAPSRKRLELWEGEVTKATWRDSHEVKLVFPSADFLGGGRFVFNIKGNDYRLVVDIDYRMQFADVFWIGTHPEYDKLNLKGG